jgi:hypothetical protein
MNHPEGLPDFKFTEKPITEAEIAAQSTILNVIDDIEQKKAEREAFIQNPELVKKLGAMLVGDSDPTKQE